MRFRVACSIVFAVGLLLPALAQAQGLKATLENPAPNSFQSGIGVLSGWVCNAQRIDVEFDGQSSLTFQVAYGTSRGDTSAVCGDANNGFGMTVNWNLLSDGQHQVRVLADGVEFANRTFKVTTLGAEVLTGVSGTNAVELAGSPFSPVLIQWSEPLQNFVIVSSSTTNGTFPLDDLLGRWDFSYASNGTTVHETYDLEEVDESEPEAFIVGTDLQDNGILNVGFVADLDFSPGTYDFFLADPDGSRCEIFFFNVTGANTVEGIEQSFTLNANDVCHPFAPPGGPMRPMTGIRTAPAPSAALQLDPESTAK